MKFFWRRVVPRPLTPADAQACFASNCVFPGLGSLLGGRRIGYAQACLTLISFTLTAVFGARFLIWAIRHWSEIQSPGADPVESLLNLWRACRGAMLGMVLFAIAWLWALVTSLSLRHRTPTTITQAPKPPVIFP